MPLISLIATASATLLATVVPLEPDVPVADNPS